MNYNDHNLFDSFFTNLEFSAEGKCFIGEKRLPDGREIEFYAKGENASDLSQLARAIEAYHVVESNMDSYFPFICQDLERNCPDYFSEKRATELLDQELDIVVVRTQNNNATRITFFDHTDSLGGHYIIADINEDWSLKRASISDL